MEPEKRPQNNKEMETELDRQKTELRKKIAAAQAALPAAYKTASDEGIFKIVVSLPEYEQARMLFCFVSMDSEVDTHRLIVSALAAGKRVCVPKCTGKGEMVPCEITGCGDLQRGCYGILEPKAHCRRVDRGEISFGLIPCVTADKKGRRLGHGGGYYDRFLAGAAFPAALLCRERLLSKEIPMMAHDVLLPAVVTEAGVFRTGARL